MKKILVTTICLFSFLSILTARSGSYFTDNELSHNTVETKGLPILMITEVMYYPLKGNEWVEIYNTSDNEINFKDWMLSDNSYTTVFHSNSDLPIAPHSFVILSHDESIKNRYDIPDGTLIITSTNWNIALHNDNDKLFLKNPQGEILDGMSYGMTKNPFDPACPDVAKGHTLERLILTIDTDTAADWVDNPNPSPGLPYQ